VKTEASTMGAGISYTLFQQQHHVDDELFTNEPKINENEGDEVLPVPHAFFSDSEEST